MTSEPKLIGQLGHWLARLYQTGGLMLVFTFTGIVALLGGGALSGAARVVLLGTGATLLMGCLLIFVFAQIRGQHVHEFAKRIEGSWWERITPDHASAISYFTIVSDPFTCTVRLEGCAYDTTGAPIAWWWSAGSCLSVAEHKLFYYWRGSHPRKSADSYEGYGEITFSGQGDRFLEGVGVYSDTNLSQAGSTCKKSILAVRCISLEEVKTMTEGTPAERQAMVVEKLKHLA